MCPRLSFLFKPVLYAGLDLVPYSSRALQSFLMGPPELGRIFKGPVKPPDQTREDRALFRVCVITNRYHIVVELSPLIKIKTTLCLVVRNVMPAFFHHFNNQGIQCAGGQPGAFGNESVTRQGIQKGLGHLTPRRVMNAHK